MARTSEDNVSFWNVIEQLETIPWLQQNIQYIKQDVDLNNRGPAWIRW